MFYLAALPGPSTSSAAVHVGNILQGPVQMSFSGVHLPAPQPSRFHPPSHLVPSHPRPSPASAPPASRLQGPHVSLLRPLCGRLPPIRTALADRRPCHQLLASPRPEPSQGLANFPEIAFHSPRGKRGWKGAGPQGDLRKGDPSTPRSLTFSTLFCPRSGPMAVAVAVAAALQMPPQPENPSKAKPFRPNLSSGAPTTGAAEFGASRGGS